ncbi:hypothetical protein PROFUN_02542 [Planoprotostelium fungivorum]|uniref:Uncharacterized protein n=1 Tax=Planoprotostelium fungivorum TaxID=1890364 RepID=A0A2P6MP91_9EUKA|nr:hypothetical protein PROFUN_02542 [Planoprotostelium fungivorum]
MFPLSALTRHPKGPWSGQHNNPDTFNHETKARLVETLHPFYSYLFTCMCSNALDAHGVAKECTIRLSYVSHTHNHPFVMLSLFFLAIAKSNPILAIRIVIEEDKYVQG